MFKSAQELVKYIADEGVAFVDYRFVDLPGKEQHFSAPAGEVDEGTFEGGVGFDGSSIRGFQEIHESDMLLHPDPGTAFLDPFFADKTLVISCTVHDPTTGRAYSRDPRRVALAAEQYLRDSGLADTAYFGPEAEFFIFDNVRVSSDPHSSGFAVNAAESPWSSGEHGDGYNIPLKGGYFPVPPADKYQDLRSTMTRLMMSIGIPVEVHHHEVASAGQTEIDMRFGTLTKMAESILKYKYVVKNAAVRAGKTATFMPKPLFGDNGSGMHVHQSLWRNGEPLFYDEGGYAELSTLAMQYVAGLLHHGPALAALTNPSVNSYRRLVPGYEAPVNLIISARNRSAVVRVPMYYRGTKYAKAKRIEYRAPDPTANPYLAFAAMLMAGLDGIKKGMAAPTPMDQNLYSLSPAAAREIKTLPRSLDNALDALEADHAFLLDGGVFTEDLIRAYVGLKREEADAVRLRPTPLEYAMYYDI